MKKYHIIKVLKTRGGESYVFWCPFCKTFHCHSSSEGYKLPHCTNQKSPYLKANGYILKEYTREEIEMWNLPIKK